jgi:hypothetical protein
MSAEVGSANSRLPGSGPGCNPSSVARGEGRAEFLARFAALLRVPSYFVGFTQLRARRRHCNSPPVLGSIEVLSLARRHRDGHIK